MFYSYTVCVVTPRKFWKKLAFSVGGKKITNNLQQNKTYKTNREGSFTFKTPTKVP